MDAFHPVTCKLGSHARNADMPTLDFTAATLRRACRGSAACRGEISTISRGPSQSSKLRVSASWCAFSSASRICVTREHHRGVGDVAIVLEDEQSVVGHCTAASKVAKAGCCGSSTGIAKRILGPSKSVSRLSSAQIRTARPTSRRLRRRLQTGRPGDPQHKAVPKHQGPHFVDSTMNRRGGTKSESPYSWFVFGLAVLAITLVFAASLFIQVS